MDEKMTTYVMGDIVTSTFPWHCAYTIVNLNFLKWFITQKWYQFGYIFSLLQWMKLQNLYKIFQKNHSFKWMSGLSFTYCVFHLCLYGCKELCDASGCFLHCLTKNKIKKLDALLKLCSKILDECWWGHDWV